MQSVVLPPVTEDYWIDTTKEPQFTKVRSNNTATMYVDNIIDHRAFETTNDVGGGNFNMFNGVKRIKLNQIFLDETAIDNITTYNNQIHFYVKNKTTDNIVYECIQNIPPANIGFESDLIAYLNDSLFFNPLPPNLPTSTILFKKYQVATSTGGSANTTISRSIILQVTDINNHYIEWDRECTFFKYGSSMFGVDTRDYGNTKPSTWFLGPRFAPVHYLDFVSNTLTKYTYNRSLTSTNSISHILYRYYFNNTDRANDKENWLNWNKSGIDRFDLTILDPEGRVYEPVYNGLAFIAAEILMEM